MTKTKTNNLEEELLNLMEQYCNDVCLIGKGKRYRNKIKQFILNREKKQREEIINEISQYSQIFDKATKDLIKIIKEL